jgi:hypothetical protein
VDGARHVDGLEVGCEVVVEEPVAEIESQVPAGEVAARSGTAVSTDEARVSSASCRRPSGRQASVPAAARRSLAALAKTA